MPANEKTTSAVFHILTAPLRWLFVIPHEVCHFVPAWAFGLNPEMKLWGGWRGIVIHEDGTKAQNFIVSFAPIAIGAIVVIAVYVVLRSAGTEINRFMVDLAAVWFLLCAFDIKNALSILAE